MNAESKEQARKPKKISLGEFVETQHKLISTLGIFCALTAFSGNLKIHSFGQMLSFAFLATTFLIFYELNRRFPDMGLVEEPLLFFQFSLAGISLLLFLYWIIQFQPILSAIFRHILTLFIFLFLASILIRCIFRYEIFLVTFERITKRRSLGYITISGFLVMLWIISLLITNLIGPPINRSFKEIHELSLKESIK